MTLDGASERLTDEARIRHLADLFFVYTDEKEWNAARGLFADGPIAVDMTSLTGGEPIQTTADDLLGGFSSSLHAGKDSHHLATNYRVTVDGEWAELLAHGYSWNRLNGPGPGSALWETWGTYRLTFIRTTDGWRIDGFTYMAKYNRGDDAIRTHTP